MHCLRRDGEEVHDVRINLTDVLLAAILAVLILGFWVI